MRERTDSKENARPKQEKEKGKDTDESIEKDKNQEYARNLEEQHTSKDKDNRDQEERSHPASRLNSNDDSSDGTIPKNSKRRLKKKHKRLV